jgi:hypothetical protein
VLEWQPYWQIIGRRQERVQSIEEEKLQLEQPWELWEQSLLQEQGVCIATKAELVLAQVPPVAVEEATITPNSRQVSLSLLVLLPLLPSVNTFRAATKTERRMEEDVAAHEAAAADTRMIIVTMRASANIVTPNIGGLP